MDLLSLLLLLITITISIVWSFGFLPFSALGLRLYKLSGFHQKRFLKKVAHASIWNNDEPEGWICGRWFVGFVHVGVADRDRNESRCLFVFASQRFFAKHIQDGEADGQSAKRVNYWFREGNFWNLTYTSRPIVATAKEPSHVQAFAIESILKVYAAKRHAFCLLYGQPGGGKSSTAHLLCAHLLKTHANVHYCNTHAPYEHGDNFASFYNKISPTDDAPLVVVFEEADEMLADLHYGRIEQKHHNPVQIKNKTSWSMFTDAFDFDMYLNVIVLLTSNKDPDWFDALDPSYLRKHRVDLKINFF